MSLFVWGAGRGNQLGLASSPGSSKKWCLRSPTNVSELSEARIVDAACGDAHTLAVTEVGDVISFGRFREGQLGRCGEETVGFVEGLEKEVAVGAACGAFHSVVVTATGRVYEFGLCHRSTKKFDSSIMEETTVAGAAPAEELRGDQASSSSSSILSRIVRESTERWLTAVDENVDEDLSSSGGFSKEERLATIGLARMDARREPTTIPRLARGFPKDCRIVAVACGYGHSLARSADGRAFGTGYNDRGQVGVGHRVNLEKFVHVSDLDVGFVTDLKAGSQHSLAIVYTEKKKQLFTWGQGTLGQLGLGRRVTGRLRPVRVSFESKKEPVKCAAGANHSICVTGDGECYFWGHAEYGQHGGMGLATRDYVDSEFFYVPRQVDCPALTDVVCGANFTLAIDIHGGLVTWGWPSDGVLARGTQFASTAPTPNHAEKLDGQPGAPKVLAIAAGARHAVAVADDARSAHALRFAKLFHKAQQQTTRPSHPGKEEDEEEDQSSLEDDFSQSDTTVVNIVISGSDSPFVVHAAILGARSRYFRGLLGRREAAILAGDVPANEPLVLPNDIEGIQVTGAMVKAVLFYAYADRVDAPPHRLGALARLARQVFCMEAFAQLCDCAQGEPTMSTFASDFKSLVSDDFAADVDLHLAGDVVLPAHRVILETSEYFQALLRFHDKSRTTKGRLQVDLTSWGADSISLDVALAVLGFIYAGTVDLKKVDPFELIIAADLLRIPPLVRTCERLLVDHMGSDPANARACLDFATRFDFCARLKRAALDVLSLTSPDLLKPFWAHSILLGNNKAEEASS